MLRIGILYMIMCIEGLCSFLWGQAVVSDFQRDRILTTHSFLLQPSNPRNAAMGFAQYATMPSSFSSTSNPAVLPFVKNTLWGGTANYLPLGVDTRVKDIFLMNASGFYKFNYKDVLTASIRYYTFGKVNLINSNFDDFGVSTPYSLAIDLSYTRRFNDYFSFALTGRYIGSQIIGSRVGAFLGNVDVIASKSVAIDFNVLYRTEFKRKNAVPIGTLQSSFSLSNMGAFFGNRYDYAFRPYLPTLMTLGFAYGLYPNRYNEISFVVEVNKLLVPVYRHDEVAQLLTHYQNISFLRSWLASFTDASNGFRGELAELFYSFGVEDWVYNRVALRAGYYHQNFVSGGRKIVTMGLGIRILDDFELALAYGYNIAQKDVLVQPFTHSAYMGVLYQFYKKGYNEDGFFKRSKQQHKRSPLYY